MGGQKYTSAGSSKEGVGSANILSYGFSISACEKYGAGPSGTLPTQVTPRLYISSFSEHCISRFFANSSSDVTSGEGFLTTVTNNLSSLAERITLKSACSTAIGFLIISTLASSRLVSTLLKSGDNSKSPPSIACI